MCFRRSLRYAVFSLLTVLAVGILLPEQMTIPVRGATASDWNPQSFWYEPWGSSGTHKGIDIFAKAGTPVIAATGGLVIYAGEFANGGKVVAVLGPRWRLHYYAHLQTQSVSAFSWVGGSEPLGTVGASGNATGKPPHLHYAILSLIPLPWLATLQTQGWKRMFYLDPGAHLSMLAI